MSEKEIEIGGFSKSRIVGLLCLVLGVFLFIYFLGDHSRLTRLENRGTGPQRIKGGFGVVIGRSGSFKGQILMSKIMIGISSISVVSGAYLLFQREDKRKKRKKGTGKSSDRRENKPPVLAECTIGFGGKMRLMENYISMRGTTLWLNRIDRFRLTRGSILMGFIRLVLSCSILGAAVFLYIQSDSDSISDFISEFDEMAPLVFAGMILVAVQFGFFGLRQIIRFLTHPSQAHFKIEAGDTYRVNLTKRRMKEAKKFEEVFKKQWHHVKNR
jgi:hypothetical protein